MQREIDTIKYQGSHGKLPKGRGLWFFMVGNTEWQFSGTYAECCKRARQEAAKSDKESQAVGFATHARIIVLP